MPTVDVYSALANPVRRKLLEGLIGGPRPAGDLAGEFSLSRPAVSEHLAVLRKAGLVREEPRGRHRYYHLRPEPLAEVGDWLHPFEHYWRARMGALRDVLDEISDSSTDDKGNSDSNSAKDVSP
ncbi:metalloregulator ArsR/SmtB family transcription factor [Streptomyces sp. NBC_01077]|uniref:ArsR/SmtB family transcription factor n=1 Tax=Streptomyces sp. NBC_01077 TaxID=2903746 RepID=UPI0038647906|nr:metalloregulator ArsR/SmtB family transcription factor [Streptomyces sp. NBC_01077]